LIRRRAGAVAAIACALKEAGFSQVRINLHPFQYNKLWPDHKLNQRVQARNKIAEGMVTKEGIAVDDLYGLVKDHPEYWSNDGVHFHSKGIAVEAEQVVKWNWYNLK
jgi:lysophospholipase L1-like esterase